MTHDPRKSQLSPEVSGLLSRLRRGIRTYVWIEGIAVAVTWIGAMFWLALALDYLPVLFGMRELPRGPRLVILIVVGLVLGWILYRWVFRRVFFPIRDSSLALLIERRFSKFDESLITTIQKATGDDRDETADERMMEQTRSAALRELQEIDIRKVFDFRPVVRAVVAALLFAITIGGFVILNQKAFGIASQRLYLLSNTPWPRKYAIEVVGVQIKRENPVRGIESVGRVVPFQESQVRVAKGASLTLMVRAQAGEGEASRKAPRSCVLRYWTDSGQRGRQQLQRIGSPRDGFQLYTIDTQPFQSILSNIFFEVRGGDHRVGPMEIRVVDEPAVEKLELHCVFPEYMVDQESNRWTPRVLDRWTNGMQLPMGTKVRVVARCNKPLQTIYAFDGDDPQRPVLKIEPSDESTFELELPSIDESEILEFILHDRDGVIAEQPHRLVIGVSEDQPPQVAARLRGIGLAVTPDVRIPVRGSIRDDYRVESSWIEIETPVTETLRQPLTTTSKGEIDTAVDFRERQRDPQTGFRLPAGQGGQIRLVVRSKDHFNLSENPNIGDSDVYQLDIVTPDRLLRILEQLEVGQRQRLEQVYQEMSEARDYIVRAGSQMTLDSSLREPGDATSPQDPLRSPSDIDNPLGSADLPDDDSQEQLRLQETRLLFAQRAILQIQKSTQELAGIAREFDSIRLQLVNNRVDSEDRKQLLQKQIIEPLVQLSDADLDSSEMTLVRRSEGGEASLMAKLEQHVSELEGQLRLAASLTIRNEEDAAEFAKLTDQHSRDSLQATDDVLSQIDAILSVLVKYETQNELLEIVRQMIEIEKSIYERTKKERDRQTLDGLFD